MADEFEEVRREIARCARDKRLRRVDFTPSAPVVWKPHEVVNPESGIPFSDITAWHFIAEQVESACEIEKVILRKPPGEIGYELNLAGAEGAPNIYVKLSVKFGKVFGRSFHNSTR